METKVSARQFTDEIKEESETDLVLDESDDHESDSNLDTEEEFYSDDSLQNESESDNEDIVEDAKESHLVPIESLKDKGILINLKVKCIHIPIQKI
jgi:hypothetical protein